MAKKIYITVELIFESIAGIINLRAQFPRDTPLHVLPNTEMLISGNQEKFRINIKSKFETEISDKRYQAFEQSLPPIQAIDIVKPQNPKIASFLNENIKTWTAPGMKVFGNLRWIYNSFFPDSGARHEFSWSLDGVNYHKFTSIQMTSTVRERFLAGVNQRVFLAIMDNPSVNEPEYFKILREAEANLEEHPKSSLILMTVALEMSLKQFLISKNSDYRTKFNGESPPTLEQIFLTDLPSVEVDLQFDQKSQHIFKNMVKNRNELVHQGIFTLSRESLQTRFRFVSDVLYLLDMYRGMWFFNQSFYEFEPRLLKDHKTIYKEDENIGYVVDSEKVTVRFEKRYWRD